MLDIRTLILVTAALALLIGISLAYVLRDYPDSVKPSIRLWILGTLLQPVAWVLYYERDALPDWITMVGANALVSFAYLKHTEAIDRFLGRATSRALLFAPVVAIAVCEVVFTYPFPSLRGRLLVGTAIYCAQMLLALYVLRADRKSIRRGHVLVAVAFAALVAVMAVRILYEGFRTETLASAFAPSLMQTFAFAVPAFFPTIASIGFVLMCNDRLTLELEERARTDPLTGISNRRTLDELATRALLTALRHERPLAVLLIDVDLFKHVNDTFGHDVGDGALRAIAHALAANLRGEDLLGRLGGEEFVVVLPETATEAARASAERLRGAIEDLTFACDGRAIPLRVSVGIAVARAGDDLPALLRRADQMMYVAKREGRNRVVGPG